VPIGLSWTAAPSGISVKRIRGIVGKTAVKFNIPEVEAVERLKDLIREHGKWVEPSREAAALEPAT
jgi:(E)-4-hydroxy-3-methylbut-2-enyl-diphosphate synthase